ncbi:PEPxxWA-CTERM sorting domain-containing protein [Porphyrobacter algicida]|uniref:PEPxxWA-CTERM sorting domain-containing protein n=1 Tax=Qipengyuania algicida TaxID=1836209 RepID=A0A845AGR4_9SPHN|nr:FxDxF family PEP-CTERM protein [Qipengyuania algicida]MXP28834.1 PEPxxWA-CTERM sorting domain-containing protein [Qipengyuania algicida]
MFKNLTLAAIVAAGLAATAPAQAADFVGNINFTSGDCAKTCTGGIFAPANMGAFDDYFTLTFPNNGTVASQVGEISIAGNVDFTSAWLVGPGAGPDSTVYNFTINNGNPSQAFLLPTGGALAGSYELHVQGTSGSDGNGYTASVTLSAVPEPATWALMILGFGAIGFSMRRRSAKAGTTRATLKFA